MEEPSVFQVGVERIQATFGTSVSCSKTTILPLSFAFWVASSYSSRDGNCFWAFYEYPNETCRGFDPWLVIEV
jgi:hypothetical protein